MHSAADIKQRSGPDSTGLTASERVAGGERAVYLTGLCTLHSLIVFRPEGKIAQIEAPRRLPSVTHQNGVFIAIYVALLVILNVKAVFPLEVQIS